MAEGHRSNGSGGAACRPTSRFDLITMRDVATVGQRMRASQSATPACQQVCHARSWEGDGLLPPAAPPPTPVVERLQRIEHRLERIVEHVGDHPQPSTRCGQRCGCGCGSGSTGTCIYARGPAQQPPRAAGSAVRRARVETGWECVGTWNYGAGPRCDVELEVYLTAVKVDGGGDRGRLALQASEVKRDDGAGRLSDVCEGQALHPPAGPAYVL
eukprot:177381-Chlamydomonas_euryale.AAC.2